VALRLLAVEGLRNLETQNLTLSPGLNLLCGDNAQGKSNFLEAVGLVCLARSFRQSPNAEMIRFGGEAASATAELDCGGAGPARTLRLALDRRFKYAFVDRQRVPQMADYLAASVPAVCFRAESLGLGRGSPELRRQFLDQLLVSATPAFLSVLRRYQRALLQRNAALKASWSAVEMSGFEAELAATGLLIVERRRRLVEELGRQATEFQKEFGETLSVRYRSTWEENQNEERTLANLKEEREPDRRAGFTRRGPHRDDLELELEGRSLRRYGSQGQVRSAVLSLKVAEIEILAASRGVRPVLVLDDVGADIDERRREKLFDYVAKDLQAFVSTTEAGALGLHPARYSRFEVRQGRLHGP
jgi:DNA replication and repair protein RecF